MLHSWLIAHVILNEMETTLEKPGGSLTLPQISWHTYKIEEFIAQGRTMRRPEWMRGIRE